MKKILILILILTCLSLAACGQCSPSGAIEKHDTLIEKYETCDQVWADLEAQYQRRHDMIPTLVKTVQAAAKHEKSTFDAVASARAKATSIQLSAKDLEDPAKMAKFQAAQGDLQQALGKLLSVRESYPELKANKNFETLMVQIEGTENRILFYRKKYNEAVSDYNKELRRFSGKVFNKVTGEPFAPRAYFKASAGAEQAPEVNFE